MPAPYADAHGGSHRSSRGRPLSLDEMKFAQLLRAYGRFGVLRDVIQKRSCGPRVIINGYY